MTNTKKMIYFKRNTGYLFVMIAMFLMLLGSCGLNNISPDESNNYFASGSSTTTTEPEDSSNGTDGIGDNPSIEAEEIPDYIEPSEEEKDAIMEKHGLAEASYESYYMAHKDGWYERGGYRANITLDEHIEMMEGQRINAFHWLLPCRT